MVGCVVRAWLRGSALERLGRLWICLEVECFIHAKLDPLSTGAGTSIVSVSSTSASRRFDQPPTRGLARSWPTERSLSSTPCRSRLRLQACADNSTAWSE